MFLNFLQNNNTTVIKTADDAKLFLGFFNDYKQNRQKIENRLKYLSGDGNSSITILTEQRDNFLKQENICLTALTKYAKNHHMASWFKGVYGLSHVLEAGLVAHIDITKAPTVGHIWSYCGLDPKKIDMIGQQNHSQTLKRITWLIGFSFKHFSHHDECLYGKLYLKRKEYETNKNLNLEYSKTAKRYYDSEKYTDDKSKEILKNGMLTEPHIDARARRWTVKIFLSHLHQVWYERHYGRPPPMPFDNSKLSEDDFKLSHEHFVSKPIAKTDKNTLTSIHVL
jgi:hypothetical protein